MMVTLNNGLVIKGQLTVSIQNILGREADHSPPSHVKVKNVLSYTSTTPYIFMAWCLVKHRDNW